MILRAPLDPEHELTAAEKVGRLLLVVRLLVVGIMFVLMVLPWHRVYRRDVPCGDQTQSAEAGAAPEFITACTGVVHPDGRAWMMPCLVILLLGASLVSFREAGRGAAIATAFALLGIALALQIPLGADFAAHPRVGNVGEPSCHIYSTMELWPQRSFYYLFFVIVGGSAIEIVTQFVLLGREWIEDRRAAKAEAR